MNASHFQPEEILGHAASKLSPTPIHLCLEGVTAIPMQLTGSLGHDSALKELVGQDLTIEKKKKVSASNAF